MVNFRLESVRDKLFMLSFSSGYDLAMHFLRVQEYYESDNPKFRGKMFDPIDYMEWYAKNKGNGCFNYPRHWAGFNVPGYIMDEVYGRYQERIIGFNKYDRFMMQLHYLLRSKSNSIKYYLIGSGCGDAETMKHEVAHAMFYLNEEYKSEQLNNVCKVMENEKLYNTIINNMKSYGYDESVLGDEVQAYMSSKADSGVFKGTNKKDIIKLKKIFIKTYKKYVDP